MLQSSPEVVRASGYLRCSSGGSIYGIPLTRVASVERPERMEWNSDSSGPDGWLPAKTGRVPVYGIARRLDTSGARESFGALVRLTGEDGDWALGFDRVERFDQQVGERQIHPLPVLIRPQARDPFRGVLSSGKDLVLCLEVDHVAPSAPALLPSLPKFEQPAPVRPSGAAPNSQTQVLRFTLPRVALSFGLSPRQVLEYVTDVPSTLVPRASKAIPGIVVWRDQPVPLVDLGLALSLAASPAKSSNVLIVQVNQRTGLVAIPTAQTTPGLQNVSNFRPSPNPDGLLPGLVKGVFEDHSGRMVIPDLDAIVHNPALT